MGRGSSEDYANAHQLRRRGQGTKPVTGLAALLDPRASLKEIALLTKEIDEGAFQASAEALAFLYENDASRTTYDVLVEQYVSKVADDFYNEKEDLIKQIEKQLLLPADEDLSVHNSLKKSKERALADYFNTGKKLMLK